MRYENKPWLFLTVNIIQIVVKVSISLVTILILRWGILGIFIGQIAGELVGSIILLINLRRYITFVYDINILKKLLMFSIPLIPGVIAYYFNQFFNRFVMLRYLSLADIGLYAIAFKIASVFALIKAAFKMAWEPFMYENLKENEHRQIYVRIYKFMILCSCISVILITLFSKELLMLLTTENYFSVYPLIGFLSIHIVITIFVHIVEIGPKITKKTFLNSLSSITGIFVNLILMFILIPKFGFMGAGYSLCIGSLVTFVLSWYFTSRVYPIEFPKIYTIVFLFFTFFFAFLNVMLDINLLFKFLLLISIFLVLAYYLKDEIKKFGPELFHLMKLEHKVKL
jgi:O-antigen/teichoic acid export membrane protein